MEEKKDIFGIDMPKEMVPDVIKEINRYYEKAIITKVTGDCPRGHKEGDTFNLTTMNHDGMCGAFYHSLQPYLMALHYNTGAVWDKELGVYKGVCPEMGKVHIEIKHLEKDDSKTMRVKSEISDMTGKGFPGIDKYRIFVEILGVENHCMWAHRAGQRLEVDPFNIGSVCGCLYWSGYHFINILLGGGSMPWEVDENIIHVACPDIYNQTTYRLVRELR